MPDQSRKLVGHAVKYPYVVGINAESRSLGTGILISAKFVLTCHHVLKGATSAEVVSQEGITRARTLKVDEFLDLALLELERPISAAEANFTDSPLRPGAVLLAVGVQETPGQPRQLSVAEIELTFLNKNDADGKILDMQFKGGARPGYSGGPVVVQEGGALHCIGILRCGGPWASSTNAIGMGTIGAFVAPYIPPGLQEGKLISKAEGNRRLRRNSGLLSRPLTFAAILCGVVILCAIALWHYLASPPGVSRPPIAIPTQGPGVPPTPTPTPYVTVWVNIPSHVYHCPGTYSYGKTKHGEYMTQAEAQKKGNRPAYGKVCK